MANPANNYCFIDNDVYGHRNACRVGPGGIGGWPVKPGDRVEYYRVENTQHSKNKWKAASFIPVLGSAFRAT